MKLVEKALLYKQRSSPVTWASYLTSLALPAWWRMRDTSGVTVVNSGSLGSALDLTATAWTMAQAGQLGAGEAGLTDGATTKLSRANDATLAAATTFEWAFLVNPSGAGEGNNGAFVEWENGTPLCRYSSATELLAQVSNGSTSFSCVTTTSLTNGVWQILFFSYSDGGDRKPHLRLGVSSAVSEFAYSFQSALTGTFAAPTGTLNLCNRALQDKTFAGLMDEAFCITGRTFTPAERLQMTLLAGV